MILECRCSVKYQALKRVGHDDSCNESPVKWLLTRTLGSLWNIIVRFAFRMCQPANSLACRLLKGGAANLFRIIIIIDAPTNTLSAQNLYVIEKDDLYGFSDKSGTPVIPPKFGLVKTFSEGIAPVYVNGTWGFVDSEGKMKIEPRFWEADNFSDGFAAVHQEGGWGYIDRNGTLVIQPRYFRARGFSEEVAPVRGETGWLFVDKTGTPVAGLSGFDDARSFNDGLAAVKAGDKWRFITHSGKTKFDSEFANVSKFNEDVAAVQEGTSGKYGFIDSSGKYVIQPLFEDARPFSEGLAAVRLNKRWGYIDKSGEMKIPNTFPVFADDFVGGLAAVSDPVRSAKIYISADGKPQFFMSTKPAETERGTASYAMCPLKVSSVPPKADVYLIPLYIWDQGDAKNSPPSKLKDSELKDYLKQYFDEFSAGKTTLDERVIEQSYMAIFVLGEEMQRRRLDLRLHDNSFSVSFEHQ